MNTRVKSATRWSLPMLYTVCSLVLMVTGCGEVSDRFKQSRPKTVTASGIALYRGKPLVGATVVLVPVLQKGIAATGITSEEGKFVLSAFPPDEGAVPGKYTATVMLLESQPPQTWSEASHDAIPTSNIKPKSLIPEKYAEARSSGLIVEITESGNTEILLELKDP